MLVTLYYIIDDDFNRYWFETVSKLGIVGKTINEIQFESITGKSMIHHRKETKYVRERGPD